MAGTGRKIAGRIFDLKETLMSKVALADALEEWNSIVAGMADTEALDKPDLQELREQLAALSQAVRDLAAEQAYLEGRRQAVTQQLRITRRRGQELTIRIKSGIVAVLGHGNELLVRSGIRPIRSRKRREEANIAVFPRPDLLAAAGLARPPAPNPAEPEA
jgi:hypothetical protein